MGVQVDIADAVRALDRLISRARDLSPAMRDVARTLEADAARRFAAEGEGDWPELDPDTLARRGGASARVLVVTGRLRDSLTGSSPDAIRQVEGDRLVFGTAVPYAPYVAGRRDPLPELDQQLADDTERILSTYLLETT